MSSKYKHEYVYYTTDESFDWNGPFGTETQFEIGLHGFSIEFTVDDYPLLETLEIFGDIDGKESEINTFEKFKNFVSDNMQYARNDSGYCTSDEVWDELFEFIDDAIKKENNKNVECCA